MMSAEDKLARVSLNAWVCQDRGGPVGYTFDDAPVLFYPRLYLHCKEVDMFI